MSTAQRSNNLSVSLSFANSATRLISFTPHSECYTEPSDLYRHCSVFAPSPFAPVLTTCQVLSVIHFAFIQPRLTSYQQNPKQ